MNYLITDTEILNAIRISLSLCMFSYSLSPKTSVPPVLFSNPCTSAFVRSLVLCPLIDVTRSPSRIPFCAALLPGFTYNKISFTSPVLLLTLRPLT